MVLATAAAAQRVKDVVIDRDYRKKQDGFIASDHAPVFADLDEIAVIARRRPGRDICLCL